jgi:hypothetical protein
VHVGVAVHHLFGTRVGFLVTLYFVRAKTVAPSSTSLGLDAARASWVKNQLYGSSEIIVVHFISKHAKSRPSPFSRTIQRRAIMVSRYLCNC